LINLGDEYDAQFAQDQLSALWRHYRGQYPRLDRQLADWICDFSLICQLPPPAEMQNASAVNACTLKEFYVASAAKDMLSYAKALLCYCSSYDYHTSKFYKEEAASLFDTHVPHALSLLLQKLSADGRVLSGLTDAAGDSQLTRDAFAGALASYRIKRRIEIDFCSFSRTGELRYLVGDAVRYAENKIRAYLGVKSRLSCYSLDISLRGVLDEYFAATLHREKRIASREKSTEAYEALYEVASKPLSIREAARIEEESWETTNKLVESFAQEEIEIAEEVPLPVAEESADGTLGDALKEYLPYLHALLQDDKAAQQAFCRACGKMEDTVVDAINFICADVLGDILIEESGDGFAIIEDYLEEVKGV